MANGNVTSSGLRHMVYTESEIGAYDGIVSSVKTQDVDIYNFNDKTVDNRSVTDSADRSLASFATSNYSADKTGHSKKAPRNDQHRSTYKASGPIPPKINKRSKRTSRKSNSSISSVNTINTVTTINTMASNHKIKDSFGKQIVLDSKHHQNVPCSKPKTNNSAGGGLAKKLNNRKIRESVETDLNASMQSAASSGPTARSSEIAKKSVVTLRMISHNPSKQIRIKLFLPSPMGGKPQIIVLFVSRGTTMYAAKTFIEENYPQHALKGKVKQLCIADDDGEIDEDFPPINNNQDITTLGVCNFWIDRIFENKKKAEKKHRDTIKERLISLEDDGEYDQYIEELEHNNMKNGCCWCCFSRSGYDAVYGVNGEEAEEDEDDSLEYSEYQKLVLHKNKNNKNRGSDVYSPPKKSDEDPFDSDVMTSKVRYASL